MLAVLFEWTARYESSSVGSGGPDTSPRCSAAPAPAGACASAMLPTPMLDHDRAADLQKLAPIDDRCAVDVVIIAVTHGSPPRPSMRVFVVVIAFAAR